MKRPRLFEIAYLGLKDGEYVYEYDIDSSFLEMMEYQEDDIHNLQCKVRLTFNKFSHLFQLKFDLDGQADVSCDRCGDDMTINIWDEYKLIVKLSFDEQVQDNEEDDDVVFLPKSETVINVADWIYEYLLLSIPFQKLHGEDENGNSLCNPEALKLLEKYKSQVEENNRKQNWKGLDQINKDHFN